MNVPHETIIAECWYRDIYGFYRYVSVDTKDPSFQLLKDPHKGGQARFLKMFPKMAVARDRVVQMNTGPVTIKAPQLMYNVGIRVKITKPSKGHSDKKGMEGTISRGHMSILRLFNLEVCWFGEKNAARAVYPRIISWLA